MVKENRDDKEAGLAKKISLALGLNHLVDLVKAVRDALREAFSAPPAPPIINRLAVARAAEKKAELDNAKLLQQEQYQEGLHAILERYRDQLERHIGRGYDARLNMSKGFTKVKYQYVDLIIYCDVDAKLTAEIRIPDLDEPVPQAIPGHQLVSFLNQSIPEILEIVEQQLQAGLASV